MNGSTKNGAARVLLPVRSATRRRALERDRAIGIGGNAGRWVNRAQDNPRQRARRQMKRVTAPDRLRKDRCVTVVSLWSSNSSGRLVTTWRTRHPTTRVRAPSRGRSWIASPEFCPCMYHLHSPQSGAGRVSMRWGRFKQTSSVRDIAAIPRASPPTPSRVAPGNSLRDNQGGSGLQREAPRLAWSHPPTRNCAR